MRYERKTAPIGLDATSTATYAGAVSGLAPGLLVSALPLADPNFDRSVVLLASHSESGAFGWVINGEQVMTLAELLSHTGLPCENWSERHPSTRGVSRGGPVGSQQVWLLYRTSQRLEGLDEQIDIGGDITASPSQAVLEAVANGLVPGSLRGVLGYAGWGPSQLESEIQQGAWFPTDAHASLVFDEPSHNLWSRAYERAGTSPIAFTSRVIGKA